MHYVGNAAYLRSCTAGAARIVGNVVGEVSEKEAAYATKVLARRRLKAARAKEAAAEAARPKKISLADLRESARQRRMATAS